MSAGTGPLNVAVFERHVLGTDKLGPEPDTAVLGLFGEIGSLVSALKKKRRDMDAYFGYQAAVLEEVGDVLWYAAALARRCGISMAEAAARVTGGAPGEVLLGDIAASETSEVGDASFEPALLELAGEAGDLCIRSAAGCRNWKPAISRSASPAEPTETTLTLYAAI
jgi:NTP pyrophosphatase (non-canonical NTP hydrolase)